MTIRELINLLEAEAEKYGHDGLQMAVSITDDAPNAITGIGDEYHDENGRAVVTLKIGWKVPS